MKTLSPVQSLLLLVLVGLAIGGWLYGLHWKRVASGDLFSSDERLMIRLQDQIATLTAENARLREQAGEAETGGESPAGAESPVFPSEPAPDLPPLVPDLPAPPQKIEMH